MCEETPKDPRDLNGDGKVTLSEKIQYKADQAKDKIEAALKDAKEDAKELYAKASVKAKEKIDDFKNKEKKA